MSAEIIKSNLLRSLLLSATFAISCCAHSATVEPVLAQAALEKAPLLDTLKELVSIESGSGDREGLDRIAALVAARLTALGGKVEVIEAGADTYRMSDTPKQLGRMVLARFAGSGSKKILRIAHMDTVYLRGMLAQIAALAGRKAPTANLPRGPLYPLAYAAEAWAQVSGREPMLTRDALTMSKRHMFFSSAKAERLLGYQARPYEQALDEAIAWFRRHGYIK